MFYVGKWTLSDRGRSGVYDDMWFTTKEAIFTEKIPMLLLLGYAKQDTGKPTVKYKMMNNSKVTKRTGEKLE